MATSTIKGGFIKKTGSKSVPSGGSATFLDSMTIPTKGVWLIYATTATNGGTESQRLHCRVAVGDKPYITQAASISGFKVITVVLDSVDSGTVVELSTFQNTGTTRPVDYQLNATQIA